MKGIFLYLYLILLLNTINCNKEIVKKLNQIFIFELDDINNINISIENKEYLINNKDEIIKTLYNNTDIKDSNKIMFIVDNLDYVLDNKDSDFLTFLYNELDYIKIDQNKDNIAKIGNGAFGIVYKVKDYNYDINYAMKCFTKSSNNKELTLTKNSIIVNKELQKDNNYINKILGFTIYNSIERCLIYELCDMDLKYAVKNKLLKTNEIKKNIILQLLEGLHEIYKKGYIHNDVKLANILVKKINGNYYIKYTDFDFVENINTKRRSYNGTPMYMTVNKLRTRRSQITISSNNDLHSILLIIYEILNEIDDYRKKFENYKFLKEEDIVDFYNTNNKRIIFMPEVNINPDNNEVIYNLYESFFNSNYSFTLNYNTIYNAFYNYNRRKSLLSWLCCS